MSQQVSCRPGAPLSAPSSSSGNEPVAPPDSPENTKYRIPVRITCRSYKEYSQVGEGTRKDYMTDFIGANVYFNKGRSFANSDRMTFNNSTRNLDRQDGTTMKMSFFPSGREKGKPLFFTEIDELQQVEGVVTFDEWPVSLIGSSSQYSGRPNSYHRRPTSNMSGWTGQPGFSPPDWYGGQGS